MNRFISETYNQIAPKFFDFSSKYGNHLKTLRTLGGFCFGTVGLFFAEYEYFQQKRLTAQFKEKMNGVLQNLEKINSTNNMYTRLSVIKSIDRSLENFDDIRISLADCEGDWLPPSRQERMKLLNYCAQLCDLQLLRGCDEKNEEYIWEKYGYRIESVLSNPFVQDQILTNRERYKSLIAEGRALQRFQKENKANVLIRPRLTEFNNFMTKLEQEPVIPCPILRPELRKCYGSTEHDCCPLYSSYAQLRAENSGAKIAGIKSQEKKYWIWFMNELIDGKEK